MYEVDDFDGYWAEIDRKGLPGQVKVRGRSRPTDFAWGRWIELLFVYTLHPSHVN